MYRILIGFLFISTLSNAQKADDIIGKYRLPNGLDVEIFKAGTSYSGKIIVLNNYEDGETKDVKNPDKAKRNDPLVGKIILQNLKFNPEDNTWIEGNLYGAEKGIFLNLKVAEMKEKEITVIGSKYFFHKTLVWKKI
jgi:hypothetical protein